MKKKLCIVIAMLMVLAHVQPLLAQRRGRSRGSVSGATRGATFSRSGNTTSWQGSGGYRSGSRSVSQTESGAQASRHAESQSGASRDVTREVDQEDREVERSSTVTTAQGETATRERTTSAEDGHAEFEGSASTSTGREAEGEGVAGRGYYGQPAVAGTVDTKYYGSYSHAATRNRYGGYTSATVGPYGGKVTTTLPSGYRVNSYHGRSYYTYGGAYYRPYTYRGVSYYYPVPAPYYTYYEDPPVGAMMLMVAGVAYLMSKDGSYSQKTTTSDGKTQYQSVPAPEGAQIDTLPAERVLVTVSGTTYYLYGNAFYRRVVEGAQEHYVVITAPAGVVFVPALSADFEVVQLNSMYFEDNGSYYVPYMSADGSEMYVLVDDPPLPPGGQAPPTQQVAATPPTGEAQPDTQAQSADPAATAAETAGAPAEPAPAIRTVDQTLNLPGGTLIMVRLQADVNSWAVRPGDRFQGFLAFDLAADGRLIAAKGARVYGVVSSVGQDQETLSVSLTDIQAGAQVVKIQTQPLQVTGDPAVVPAQTLQTFTTSEDVQIHLMTSVAVRGN